MVRRWYPGGAQPETATPLLIPICEQSPGREPMPQGGALAGPVLLRMHCATQGASIEYALERAGDPHWLLYTGPLRLPEGRTIVRARASRIGYRESGEGQATFVVT